MRILSVALSGTGNTAWALDRFREEAASRGHSFRALSAAAALGLGPAALPAAELERASRDAELLLLAYPIYGADFPPAMKRVLARIAALPVEGRAAACLCTMGYVDAQGPFAAARALRRAGLELRGYLPLLMSNNVSVPGLRASFARPEALAARMEAARRALPPFMSALERGERYLRGVGPYLLAGPFIRMGSARRLARPSALWGWDGGRCSRCGGCVRGCPMACLSFEGGRLSFGEDCTYCARCYNACPRSAILPFGKYADPAIYGRYSGPPDPQSAPSGRSADNNIV